MNSNHGLKKLTVGFLAALAFTAGLNSWSSVKTGSAAPNFTLPSDAGKKFELSQLTGKWVVLEWTNHECPYVVKHYGSSNMQSLQKKYGAEDVQWFSIISSAEGKQGFVSPKESMSLTKDRSAAPRAVLLDPKGTVGRLYGAKTTPHMFIINPKGFIVYQGAIDDTVSTDPEDIPNSKNYVDMAFMEAKAGQSISHHTTAPYGCSVKY